MSSILYFVQVTRFAYTACMIRFAVFALLLVCYAMPAVAAESEVMPPPTSVKDTPQAKEDVGDSSGKLDLHKELNPDTKDGVQVYVFESKDGAKVEEYSVHGRVYMIHVQPPGNLPAYYLYDREGSGNFHRLPGGYKPTSPPMWVIKRF